MTPAYLAPMQGLTDAAFRTVCFGYGCRGAVTEMVETGTYAHTRKKLSAIEEGMTRFPEEGELYVQLIGKEPGEMGWSAARVTALGRFDGIDVNMACPARKVTSGGSGCALMNDPARAAEILRAVMANTDLPVTLKLRLGWDEASKNAPQLAALAEQLGVTRITLHGRTRAQHYSGQVDREAMRRVTEAVRIPVLANGDVRRPGDAARLMADTGATGVSIGRATLLNPWIFEDIARLEQGLAPLTRDVNERTALLLRLLSLSLRMRPERLAVMRMRKFTPWYLDGMTGLGELTERVNRMERADDYTDAIREFAARLTRAGDPLPHPECQQESVRLSLS